MTVFLLLGVLGTAMLVLGLIGGELLDGLFDAIGLDIAGGLFSTEAIGGFLAAFGLGGWVLGEGLGLPTIVAAAGGTGAGVVMAAFAIWLTRTLINVRTDHTPTSADLRGALGRVVTPIPEGGVGEVKIRRHGHPLKLTARSETPIARGVEVVVVEVTSATSVLVAEAGIDLQMLEPDT